MNNEYRICKRCVMDTTDENITFDENGYCNHCTKVLKNLNSYPFNLNDQEKETELKKLVDKIKADGKGKKYDCIIGVSGGADSTYVAYLVKKLGLRPLAVHVDNGWNSDLSVKNIENTLNKLGIELYTHVLDWDEFRDLQLSYIKSSTPDLEVPTDHAIYAVMFKIASKNNIKYILSGYNYKTESILPPTWSNGGHDWKYISYIQKTFGTRKLKNYPHRSLIDIGIQEFILKIKRINILDYVDYNKKDATEIVSTELGWKPYPVKHGESVYTKFIQSYILPVKFGYDKRKSYMSALICSGQLTRDEALEELKKDIYTPQELNETIEYVCDKLEITKDDFEKYMKLPNKTYFDYPSYDTNPILVKMKKVYHNLNNTKYFRLDE
ncbi:N-acetyl sugar amidotransferase [Methanococcus voltae]|uniref:N-acetyl sugar amidotransferase n=1 Tax=Methanococcus voltae (strain ATCC BAA-1334 / A3) TaxID=456320 RepID=D7DRY4_METV3|nr:N-acetyl sugar amidotransferase [Methanococcus voltae]MCS3901419.1 N-acetyl sugar amidotransferase [Methanococcus voltae]